MMERKAKDQIGREAVEQIATKRDLQELELRLKHDLTVRLGAMLVAGISIVAALVKLL
ncbi:MAG: hypothetical protein AB1424_10445 [Thermodesulfobacteriota bacterium]